MEAQGGRESSGQMCVYLTGSDCVTDSAVIVIIKLNQQQTQQLLEVVRSQQPVNIICWDCIEKGGWSGSNCIIGMSLRMSSKYLLAPSYSQSWSGQKTAL